MKEWVGDASLTSPASQLVDKTDSTHFRYRGELFSEVSGWNSLRRVAEQKLSLWGILQVLLDAAKHPGNLFHDTNDVLKARMGCVNENPIGHPQLMQIIEALHRRRVYDFEFRGEE